MTAPDDPIELNETRCVPPTVGTARTDETVAAGSQPVAEGGRTDDTVAGSPSPSDAPPAPEARRRPRRRKSGTDVLPDIEGYEILSVMGRGGMGVVYDAVQSKLNRAVAVKLLPAVMGSAQPELIKRFRDEAASASRLHHPHIIPIYDFGESRDGYYYVMEKLEGQPMDAVIQRLGALDPGTPNTSMAELIGDASAWPTAAATPDSGTRVADDEGGSTVDITTGRDRAYYRRAAQWIADIADALYYAHQQGIIHRDIKPSNVFLCSDGRAILLDFGLVKLVGDDSMTRTGTLIGSYRYMSPEQLGGSKVGDIDHRTDIYSLGATLYELLTFQPVHAASDQAVLFEQIAQHEPTAPRRLIPAVPADLETICLKAIDKRAAGRYETAKAMADDLHLYLRGLPITARRVGRLGQAVRWVRRHRARVVTALILTLLGVAVALAVRYERRAWEAHVDTLVTRGVSSMKIGKWTEAQSAFQEAIQEDPNEFRALVNLAIVKKELFYKLEDPALLEDANSLLDRVLELSPGRKEIWNMKGIVLRTQGRLDDAIAALEHALSLDPEYYSTWVNLGGVYALRDDLAEAAHHLQEGVNRLGDRRDPIPWHNLAAVQLELREPTALTAIEHALAADITAVPSQMLRAKLHLFLDGHRDARLALRYATAAEVNNAVPERTAAILRLLAVAHLQLQEWTAAEEAVGRALAAGDDECYSELALAIAAAGQSRLPDAEEHLQRGLAAWPAALRQRDRTARIEGALLWFESRAERQELADRARAALGR